MPLQRVRASVASHKGPPSSRQVDVASVDGGIQRDAPIPVRKRASVDVDRVAVDLKIWTRRPGRKNPAVELLRGAAKVWRRAAAVVEGEVVYTLAKATTTHTRLHLLNFAEAWPDDMRGFDESRLAEYLHGPFQAGRLAIESAVDQSGLELEFERVGERRDVSVRLAPGVASVRVRYRVAIPRRMWPFGCVRGRCSLSGAIAPLPSEAIEGRAGERVVDPARWRVSACYADDWHRERWGPIHVADASGTIDTHFATVVWGPGWHRHRFYYRGVSVTILLRLPRPTARYPHEAKLGFWRDGAGRLESLVRDALDFAGQLDSSLARRREFTVVQGPLASHLARPIPGGIMIASRWLEAPNWSLRGLFPFAKFLDFHSISAVNAMFRSLSNAHATGFAPNSRSWVGEFVAAHLTERWRIGWRRGDDDALDLLRNVSFFPSVDRFLYSGQATNHSAYLRGVEEERPLRNDPLWFSHSYPDGRRFYSKLSEYLETDEMAELSRELVQAPRGDASTRIETSVGLKLDWFFDQWSSDSPRVDYALHRSRSRKLDTGGYETTLTIEQDAERPIVEPVQIHVETRRRAHRWTWSGELGPGRPASLQPAKGKVRYRLLTDEPIRAAVIDPLNRTRQSSRIPPPRRRRGDNSDPLYNDRSPPTVKFLYAGFGLNVAASEMAAATDWRSRLNAISALAAFRASRRRDLSRGWMFDVHTTRETLIGGSASLRLNLFDKITNNRRRATLRFGSSAAWLADRGLDPHGGLRLMQSMAIAASNRRFLFRPERGYVARVGVNAAQVLRFDGPARGDHRFTIGAGAIWSHLVPVVRGHVLATLLELDLALPVASEPEFRSLVRGGGIGSLQAYLGSELFGQGMVHARLEYRHSFLENLHINLFNLAWVRDLRGAAFVAAATMSSCDGLDGWFSKSSWYGEVGYGLSSMFQLFGLSHQLVRLDVSVPLVRRTGTTCLGRKFPDAIGATQGLSAEQVMQRLPPFSFNLTFAQPF